MFNKNRTAPRPVSTLRIFFPFAFGYFLSYLFRVVNAVIAPDLVAELGLGPSDLGLLTAVYFVTFAAFQLPLGILLDHFGPRKVESILLIFAGMGALIFARAQGLPSLILGRGLIGFGVSACLMAAFKSYVLWFPPKKLPAINGFQMAAGGLGALMAATPMEWALGHTDWRGAFTLLALACPLAAIAVFTLVPEKKKDGPRENLGQQIREMGKIFVHPIFLRIAPLATLSQAGYISIQGLWAGPWLRDVAGFTRHQVALTLSLSAATMILGFITMGKAAQHLAARGIPVRISAAAGMGSLIFIQALLAFNAPLPAPLLIALFGFFGTSGILSYTALTLDFPAHLSGRVTTAINLLVFIAAFAVQWAIGGIIDLFPHPGPDQYALPGYQAAFTMVLTLQCLGLAWFFIYSRRHAPSPINSKCINQRPWPGPCPSTTKSKSPHSQKKEAEQPPYLGR